MSPASKNSITISSIEFAELLAKICKITGKSAGSQKHHWQFMRFIRRHRGKILQQVGETVKLTRLRRHKNSKFSEVAMLSEKQVVEYIKIHKSTKGVAEEIEKKLKSMSGFAPLAEKLRFVRDDLKGVVVDPTRLAEVKKQCLKIPVLKDRKQLIFSKVKDGQLINGCAAMLTYRTHYTLILQDYEEEYLPKSEFEDLGIEDDGEEYIIKTHITETRSKMVVQAGVVVKIVNVHAADPRYFECRMFLPGSDMAIVLIHYSALVVLDISMRREVIKIIKESGLFDFCNLFDVVGKVENKKITNYFAK
jgi:hypothetical protein